MTARAKCPVCGKTDQVEKVSTLYLLGIGLDQPSKNGELPQASGWVRLLPPDELRSLSRRLRPPAGEKAGFTRPLHPDMVVIVFSLILPVFLYGIWTSQKQVLPAMLLVLAGAYIIYFWKRKAIVARFQQNQANRQTTEERARRSVGRWMRLYYCNRDDGVFDVSGGELIPADQMPGYLFNPEK